ncbi:hypothetical protein LXL04_038613 [Taraxacum kok-saghyz]
MGAHQGCVNTIAWNSKRSLLISGSDDTRVNVWSYESRKLLQSIESGHTLNIFCTKFVPETCDDLVASGAADTEVRLFNLSRTQEDCNITPSALFQCHTGRVKKLAIEPASRFQMEMRLVSIPSRFQMEMRLGIDSWQGNSEGISKYMMQPVLSDSDLSSQTFEDPDVVVALLLPYLFHQLSLLSISAPSIGFFSTRPVTEKIEGPLLLIRNIYEALELRDGDKGTYLGNGVTRAVKNVNEKISEAIVGMDPTLQNQIDQAMIDLDKTEKKGELGGNAILAVSMAACKAGAAEKEVPLYKHIADLSGRGNHVLPVPAFTLINGGKHAGNNLALRAVITEKFGAQGCNVGEDGGFAPNISRHESCLFFEEGLDLVKEAINRTGYNGKLKIAIDVAATDFCIELKGIGSERWGKSDTGYGRFRKMESLAGSSRLRVVEI